MRSPTESKLIVAPTPRGTPAFLWDSVLCALLLGWGLSALNDPWGTLAPNPVWSVLAAVVGCLLPAATAQLRTSRRRVLRVLPWLALLPWAVEAVRGLLLWFNCLLTLWNTLHRGGLTLFDVEATARSVQALSVLASFALGELVWWMVVRRRVPLCGALGLVLLLVELLTGVFEPLAGGLWLTALLGLWMSGDGQLPPRQTLRLWSVGAAVLLVCAVFGSQAELASVTRARDSVSASWHTLRYGDDALPQGDLGKAAQLQQGTGEPLSVQTGQEKNLYLRAFVGAEYADGVWLPLSGEAYGDTYAGMLKWLAGQGFDPLTQPALYYALSDPSSAPEENMVRVEVKDGARCYLYVPATTANVSTAYTEKKDLRMAPRGLFGASFYTVQERSSARPSELTIRADWVAEPQNEAQSRYAQAEAVYRSFVYDRYTQVDAQLQPLLEELFWQDYEPENDGIYSAVDRVRSVLKQQAAYAREPADTFAAGDRLPAFLHGAYAGNDVLYASAAVEALRCHGIPARYVEGYYCPSSAEDADGRAVLTAENAHAWVEVYFDGIGWLPVDVTPGYYYDAVTLREMIALPDTVRKTAALDDGSDGGSDISTAPDAAGRPTAPEVIQHTAFVLLGLIAAAVLGVTLWFLMRRLMGALTNVIRKRRYLRADAAQRAQMLQGWIYTALTVQGLDACLGWNTAETDAACARDIPGVAPGENNRAGALMEKFTYGGVEPEAYELRVLQTFLEKVFDRRRFPCHTKRYMAKAART